MKYEHIMINFVLNSTITFVFVDITISVLKPSRLPPDYSVMHILAYTHNHFQLTHNLVPSK
jgi:hypothetical protein